MNERIKQLWNLSRNPSGRGHDEEKFAELLIRECTSVCEEHRQMYGSLADTDVTFAAMTTAAGVCGDSIKKHFGVEE